MIKDKLNEAVKTSLNNIKKGDDYIPLGMRGELEVIVKDRDGNVLSYERDHNQVTKLAKMAIIHLLAGEIGTFDAPIYSKIGSDNLRRAYTLDSTEAGTKAEIFPRFTTSNHKLNDESYSGADINLDGQLVSGEQYFYDGTKYLNWTNGTTSLTQIMPVGDLGSGSDKALSFNFPTKMLFGTGLEAFDSDDANGKYASDLVALDATAIARLNGYSSNDVSSGYPSSFFDGCNSSSTIGASSVLTNWYSAEEKRCRTLQPASTQPINSFSPSSSTTAIRGAIKNCFITSTNDTTKYNGTTKMAMPDYRGCGYPCFIYAKRSTQKFYDTSEGNQQVHYEVNSALGNVPYETEITYTVDMPAQAVNSSSVTMFYPYNGWILRQAGLFCDSKYAIRSVSDTDNLSETSMLNTLNTGDSDTVSTYRDNVGGQMLFTRNLSSPVLKTPDNEIVFVWHIFITIND